MWIKIILKYCDQIKDKKNIVGGNSWGDVKQKRRVQDLGKITFVGGTIERNNYIILQCCKLCNRAKCRDGSN